MKYILRTDIMYRKSTDGAEVDPREEEALQLVQDAERLEVQLILIKTRPGGREARGTVNIDLQLVQEAKRLEVWLILSYNSSRRPRGSRYG